MPIVWTISVIVVVCVLAFWLMAAFSSEHGDPDHSRLDGLDKDHRFTAPEEL